MCPVYTLMLLDYKSNKWWAALRGRVDRNTHGYTGVWLKNGISYYFDLVVRGQRYRQGGFKTAEEAALARDCVIVTNRLPHRKSFGDSHYDYLVNKYGFYDLKVGVLEILCQSFNLYKRGLHNDREIRF